MAYKLYTQGEDHILATYLQDVAFTGPFYIGLGTGPMPAAENSSLSDILEVTGTNYARQQVQRNNGPYGWSVCKGEARSAQVSWQNLGTTVCWTPADYVFLTLSPLGLDTPDILIAAVDLDTGVSLKPKEKLRVIYKLRLL